MDSLVEWVGDGQQGRLFGAAGDMTLNAIVNNPNAFLGNNIVGTIKQLVEALADQQGFQLVRTPAAWCMRFPALIQSVDVPCLPAGSSETYPDFSKCVPSKCGFAGHSSGDLKRAQKYHRASKALASDTKIGRASWRERV